MPAGAEEADRMPQEARPAVAEEAAEAPLALRLPAIKNITQYHTQILINCHPSSAFQSKRYYLVMDGDEIDQIGGQWRRMKGEIPCPAWEPLEIVP